MNLLYNKHNMRLNKIMFYFLIIDYMNIFHDLKPERASERKRIWVVCLMLLCFRKCGACISGAESALLRASLFQVAPGCSRLLQAAPGCSRLLQAACSKAAPGWLLQAAPGWEFQARWRKNPKRSKGGGRAPPQAPTGGAPGQVEPRL